MENNEVTEVKEVKQAKVINLNKYKSTVANSPLLSGDSVEVKAYTNSMSNMQPNVQTMQQPQNNTIQPPVNQPPKQNLPPINENYSFNPVNNDFAPPPPLDDDGIDPMQFGEKPAQPESKEAEEDMSPRMAEQSAGMMISMYSMMVPPILASMLKNDVSKFKMVLSYNKQIPQPEVDKLEKFLLIQNKEIEKALQLTKEQVVLLKQALAAVIRHYKVEPKNPLVNLLMVVIGIAVTQFMAIRQIVTAQNEHLMAFIQNFGVTVPEGVKNPLKRNLFQKKSNLQEAA